MNESDFDWEPVTKPPFYAQFLEWFNKEIENAIKCTFEETQVYLSTNTDGEVTFSFQSPDFSFGKEFVFDDMIFCYETPEDIAECFEKMAKSIRDGIETKRAG